MKDTALTEKKFADKRAAEYRSRGYEVFQEVPLDFMPGFRADLLVRKDGETKVIEVRTRSSLAVDSSIRELADALSSKQGWTFDLLLVGEPEQLDAPEHVEPLTAPIITKWIEEAERALGNGFVEAAFLMTWSACEAAIRELIASAGLEIERVTQSSYLIGHAVGQGAISESEGEYLSEMLAYRNAMAHGFLVRDFDEERARQLVVAAKALHGAAARAEHAGQETVLPISLWDPLNLRARLDEFLNLSDGWLEGRGVAPRADHLDWLDATFKHHFPDDCPRPYAAATPEGGVFMEWLVGRNNITLEIDLKARLGEFYAFNLGHEDVLEFKVHLDDDDDWERLIDQIRRSSAVSA